MSPMSRSVSLLASWHLGNELFAWDKLAAQGASTAIASQEEVDPASEYKALRNQLKELQ